jgi:hypothetical protein
MPRGMAESVPTPWLHLEYITDTRRFCQRPPVLLIAVSSQPGTHMAANVL